MLKTFKRVVAGILTIFVLSAEARAEDRSTLWLEAKTRATLLFVDDQGRRLGVDPISLKTYQEIPGSTCETDFIDNRYTGEQNVELYERLTVSPVKPGRYTLRLRGLQNGPFEVNISGESRAGNSIPYKQVEGLISKGQDLTFQMQYEDNAEHPMTIIEKHRK